jgi:hypothetical protein
MRTERMTLVSTTIPMDKAKMLAVELVSTAYLDELSYLNDLIAEAPENKTILLKMDEVMGANLFNSYEFFNSVGMLDNDTE